MAEHDGSDTGRKGLTRRDLIKRAAIVGGTAAWAAPVIRLAMGAGDTDTVTIGGAQLAAFTGTCSSVPLGPTSLTVCAINEAAAKQLFKDIEKVLCENTCGTRGPCSGTNTCKLPTEDGTSFTQVTCIGPGTACPPGPYGPATMEFVCASTVTCNCACLT